MAWTRCLTLLTLLAGAGGLSAQVTFDRKVLGPAIAAGLIGQQSPLANPLILQNGQNNGVWIITPFVAQRVSPEAEKSQLKDVRDKTDARRDRGRDYLITLARRVAPEDLAKAADRAVTYPNLFDQPAKHRGQVVHIEGKLRQVIRHDAPVDLMIEEPDIRYVYEGWIYGEGDLYGRNPFVVLFTELPSGVTIGTKLEYQVYCDAYFYKKLRYVAKDATEHYAPMLIARTVNLIEQKAAAEEPSPLRDALPFIVSGIFSVILLGGALLLFFRRGDKAVTARLREVRETEFVAPPPELPASPAPAVEPEPADREKSEK